ncbi:alcohol dehydrogenase [Mycolicibacterium conceptionense]|uniref:alcohol dehydrogenase (NADP(+)) n=1 Tax=Mycolicibacterium conceptionense TaxID=451644 RepID=A0A0U1DBI3_9MYCO|nr:alcohol dehydrogenase [Mycolicibacterium conceptionense]
MSTVYAYAANSATEPLAKTTITRREVGPHDVAFDIHFAGICHSDIHTVKGEWGTPNYPVVAGHEIAGVVTEVGSEVTKYKVGDHVASGVSSTRVASATTARLGCSSTAPAAA